MWFPYSLPTAWKRESNREPAHDALADREQRPFLVAFYLHNPVSREWSVELQLREQSRLTLEDSCDNFITVGFYPDEHERLAEIHCNLAAALAQMPIRAVPPAIAESPC